MCLFIWFQFGSFEAEVNPSGRVKSSEPTLSLRINKSKRQKTYTLKTKDTDERN